MSRYRDDEIRRFRKDEEQRSKRSPPDPELVELRKHLKRQNKLFLKNLTWKEVSAKLGLQPEMPEYGQWSRIYRDYRRSVGEPD